MAVSAVSGPLISYGQTPYLPSDYNPDLGSSLFWGGAAILDPRLPFTYLVGEAESQVDYGWWGIGLTPTLTAIPYTAATGAIVASANATAAKLVLVSASSATTGVYITPSIIRSDTAVIDTNGGAGLVAIEAYSSITASVVNGILTVSANATMPVCPGMVLFTAAGAVSSGTVAGTVVLNQLTGASGIIGHVGTWNTSATNLNVASGTVTLGFPNVQSCIVPQGGLGVPPSIAMWNPQALTSRVLQVTAAAGATATTATISGYDIYGYPMVEAITIVAGGTAAGKKAFKYVKSVVLNASDATHAYSVDTLDVYGLPLRADSFGETLINYASASATAAPLVTAVAGFTPSDRTTATSTTGDVRGTYALQSAATTNTSLLQIRQNLVPANVATAFGMFGTTQFANF